MIPTATDLLREIDSFLKKAEMSDATFSRAAVKNAKWLTRLRENLSKGTGDIKLAQAARAIAYIKENKRKR